MTWVKIDAVGNYEINEKAEVRNATTSKILKPFKHKSGYLYVTLCEKGRNHNYRLHRLVAKAFIPNPYDLKTVNHKDLNKENNSVENLEWMSITDNNRHARKHITFQYKTLPPEERKKRSRNAYIKQCKKVGMYKGGKLIKVFESISQASRETGRCRRSIEDRVLNHINTPLLGFEWKLVKE